MRISDWSSDVCSSDLISDSGFLASGSTHIQNRMLFYTTERQDSNLYRGCRSPYWKAVGCHPRSISSHRSDPYPKSGVAKVGARNAIDARRVLSASKIGRASCRERVCQYV